jgi:hypothetical protein
VSDPKLPSGAINNNGQTNAYAGPFAITSDVTIKARFRHSAGAWSALSEITYDAFIAGDYDGDMQTNGNDFLAWQRQLGSPASPSGAGADGNRNGLIDEGDLASWKAGFGYGSDPAATEALSAAVVAAADEFDLPESAFFGGTLEFGTHGDEDARSAIDQACSRPVTWLVQIADAPLTAPRRPIFRPASLGKTDENDSAGANVAVALDAALADIL